LGLRAQFSANEELLLFLLAEELGIDCGIWREILFGVESVWLGRQKICSCSRPTLLFVFTLCFGGEKLGCLCWHIAERSNYTPTQTNKLFTTETRVKTKKKTYPKIFERNFPIFGPRFGSSSNQPILSSPIFASLPRVRPTFFRNLRA
jgi:hypothetical protein